MWDTLSRRELEQLKPAARSLRIQLQLIELKTSYDFDAAFMVAKKEKAGAVIVLGESSELYVNSARLGEIGLGHGVPLSGSELDLVHAGRCLCGSGPHARLL